MSRFKDDFAKANLPPRHLWPELALDHPGYRYPDRLNCVHALLDRWIEEGHGDRIAFVTPEGLWTYADMAAAVNRLARVLVEDMGLIPGNRVLLRVPNNPFLVAAYLAVIKAGGIAVGTMPLLRASELAVIIDKAKISHALCDARLQEALLEARRTTRFLRQVACFGDGLEARMAGKPAHFEPYDSAADDVCLIAFTSGTTGNPKGTMHFHRDLLAICDAFPRHALKPRPDDLFCGTPPLAFTFGLGGLALFPMHIGAAALLLEKAAPPALAAAIERFRPTICFASPTAWRALLGLAGEHDLSSLRKGVSAGEHLPAATFEAVEQGLGLRLIDGIGSTEMLHIFISSDEAASRPGATGRPLPGYQAKVIDAEGRELPPGVPGLLAVKGPTGCRYLDDPRQRDYVRDGWNITQDVFLVDEDGYFWFQGRADDMIVSSGYNIAAPEVENALLGHPAVAECAVIGAPDPTRGQIAKAYVVLAPGHAGSPGLATQLQDHVKAAIAPYKYPREVVFVDTLPKTATGKLQRFRLRAEPEMARAA